MPDVIRASVGGHTAEAALTVNLSGSVLTGDVEGTFTTDQTLSGDVNLTGDLVFTDGAVCRAGPGLDVEGNGHQIMFMDGASADWRGTPTDTWSHTLIHDGDQWRADVTKNLDRDVNFRNLARIMWHAGAGSSTLRYFTVHDSGTTELGFYPLHWHLNGDSSRGTLVEGVVVRGGQHHAYVPHGSNGITFLDCIADDTHDDAFWWDRPGTNRAGDPHPQCPDNNRYCTLDNSNDTTYDHCLVDGVTEIPGVVNRVMTGFLLGAGDGNVVRDSVAVNVVGPKNSSGFHWPSTSNLNVGGSVWLFENCHGESKNHGIFVWQNEPGRTHIVDGFTGGGIEQGAYVNHYIYRNTEVPYVNVHAGGWGMENSKVGRLLLASPQEISPNDPTFYLADMEIGELILNNRASQERTLDPVYEFTNIGMGCGDIQVVSVEPGTQLWVDGQLCQVE